MITEPKTSSACLLSGWSADIALLCLGIGLHGATTPLLPATDLVVQSAFPDDISRLRVTYKF
jgi:hypothetical protein